MSATPADARRILQAHFGFSSFRDGQERLVSAALAGLDVLRVLPTGGGESLCYQVPAL
jgi:ATP-dependent DNA helicase RecQ